MCCNFLEHFPRIALNVFLIPLPHTQIFLANFKIFCCTNFWQHAYTWSSYVFWYYLIKLLYTWDDHSSTCVLKWQKFSQKMNETFHRTKIYNFPMKKKQPAKNQRSIFFFIPLLKNLNLAPPPPPSRSHFFRNKSDDTCDTIAFSTVFSTIILSYVIIMHRLLIFYAFYSLSSLKKIPWYLRHANVL